MKEIFQEKFGNLIAVAGDGSVIDCMPLARLEWDGGETAVGEYETGGNFLRVDHFVEGTTGKRVDLLRRYTDIDKFDCSIVKRIFHLSLIHI